MPIKLFTPLDFFMLCFTTLNHNGSNQAWTTYDKWEERCTFWPKLFILIKKGQCTLTCTIGPINVNVPDLAILYAYGLDWDLDSNLALFRICPYFADSFYSLPLQVFQARALERGLCLWRLVVHHGHKTGTNIRELKMQTHLVTIQ